MRDAISITRVTELHPAEVDNFRNFINDAETGLNEIFRIVQGYRTFPEQQAIYNQGRTTPGKIVTKSKPGASYHNYGFAIDLVRMNRTVADWGYDYSLLKPYADKYNIKWGGMFKSFQDLPHFEKPPYHWKLMLEKYNKQDFIPGTTYINI